MKKLQSLVVTCISMATLTAFSNSYAYHRANSLTFVAGGGFEHFSPKRHYKNAGLGFATFGYDFTNHWGAEGTVGYFRSTFKNDQQEMRGNVHGEYLAIDGIYYFDSALDQLQPFAKAGYGMNAFSHSRFDASNQGNLNFGLGVDYFVHKVVALRVEGRDFYTLTGGKNDLMLDAGLVILWDLC